MTNHNTPLRTKSDAGTPDLAEITRAIEQRDTAMAARLEKAEGVANTAQARLDEMEQKIARRGGGDDNARELTWGEQFIEGIDLKTFSENASRRKQSEGLVLTKATVTTAEASAGGLLSPYRDQAVLLPRRRLRIRDLIPTIRISTGAVEYPKQTARPMAAGMVPETTLKPESAMSFTMETAGARVIAHWIPASRQILDDAPQLRDMIDTDLRYGLELKEDEQILTGSGTGENLYGLIPQATDYTAPFVVDGETIIDKVGLAILQAALTEFPPDGIVLHPTDWMKIRLTKDADGRYIFGNPAESSTAALWGLPVVETTSMPVNRFLVGSFQAAATIYDRWLPRVEISTEHADYFIRNLVAILAEERLAFAVKNPNAVIYGSFATGG